MHTDRFQEQIITLSGVRALVLAGPGCGKTHLLTRRIIHAHAVDGVPFEKMICLTFTNRASREMNSRIRAEFGYSPQGLFVGNLHRFCCRLLSENSLLPAGSSLLDEDDRDAWLAEALGARRKFERKQISDLAMLLFQQEHDFPEPLRRKLDFTPTQPLINAATAYRDFKAEHRLIDFDDLLLLAYLHLSTAPRNSLKGSDYSWVQVDEVQDLTPLQLAIVDLITSDGPSTAVYLGDEQQAIFEFIGAGGPALDKLKLRCADRIFRLDRNYRSPDYLVELCNRFGVSCLGLSADNLPKAVDNAARHDDALRLLYAADHNLPNSVAACVRAWRNDCPDERIAVLTRTNDEAEEISALLTAHGLENTLVGRNDLFRRPSYKTICAHLSVIVNPSPSTEWSQLLFRTHAVRTLNEARGMMRQLDALAINPAVLLGEEPLNTASVQHEFLSSPTVRHISEKFRKAYLPLYEKSLEQLRDPKMTIAHIADSAYEYLTAGEFIAPVPRWNAVSDFLRRLYPETSVETSLPSRLAELRTFNEGDLLDRDRVTVITIHKAKGLEFDNVIIYNAAQSNIPHHGGDDARVLYVAISRARRRLAIFTAGRPSANIIPIAGLLTTVPADTVEASALIERLHSRPPRRL